MTEPKSKNANVAADRNVALIHTLNGSPAASQRSSGVSAGQSNIAPANWGYHDYKPPKRRHRDNPDIELCAAEDCRAYPADGYQFCIGHARAEGLLKGPKCKVAGCRASPMKGTGYCYPHGEKAGLAHQDEIAEDDLFDVDAG